MLLVYISEKYIYIIRQFFTLIVHVSSIFVKHNVGKVVGNSESTSF